MFRPNPLYRTDGYKPGHQAMLAPGTTRLYGTWIPRNLKHAPKGIKKIVSALHQGVWREIHDIFDEYFFKLPIEEAMQFPKDMELYLMLPYDGDHFEKLWEQGYLPLAVQALPEGIETLPNIPHQTFINTLHGFAWLTLYMETIVSNLAWEGPTAATIARQYRKICTEWVMKTDPENMWLVDYMCHDFSSRGLSGEWSQIAVGLGHAMSFRGSDTLIAIPAARYYYNEPKDEVIINSVLASEHSVTCTGIFYYQKELKAGNLDHEIKKYYDFDAPCDGSVDNPDYLAIAELLNLRDWLIKFPKGILSVVSDTFNLWKLITFILPRLKDLIMARDGKLVIRPDSGDPADIVCGEILYNYNGFSGKTINGDFLKKYKITSEEYENSPQAKGVIELLWDAFGGTVNEQGYNRLDSHIGCIYGDSITLDRQLDIYSRLADKGYSSTVIVLGVGSFTYRYTTRDTEGWAAKGAWFETHGEGYNIYKDPITDDGGKKSLKGFQFVYLDKDGEYQTMGEVTEEKAYSEDNILQLIYKDGKFFNQTTFTEIRNRLA